MAMIESEKTDILMPKTLVRDDPAEFFQALKISRLLDEHELRTLEENHTGDDLSSLFELLIAEGKLTPYQLNRIRQGELHGLILGSYQILDELGCGGVGQVYKAKHTVMDRVVALKVTAPEGSRERTARDQFRREVAAITRLNHPNVALTFDANEVNGVLFLAMEYVEGPTLQRHVTEDGPLAIPLACSALLQTARALQHAHENGLVHRDIKPGNLMLPGVGRIAGASADPSVLVKVVDFGLARLHPRGNRQLTTLMCREGATMGTPAFIAPEQIRNIHAADIRSDLYSLGCTFYFALTGHLPFEGATTQATLALQLERESRPIRSWRSAIPVSLAGIIHRLMAKNPADRYQTPEELIDVLNSVILSGDLCDGEREDQPRPLRAEWRRSFRNEHRSTAAIVVPSTLGGLPEPPSLSGSEAKIATERLRGLWHSWCAVIEHLIQGHAPELRDEEYKALYRKLMESVRAARGSASDGLREKYQELQSVVEPWVSLMALVSLDGRTLAELWQTCRAIDVGLWPHPAEHHSQWLRTVVGFLIVGLALVGVVWNAPESSRFLTIIADLARTPPRVATVLMVPIILLFVIVFGRKGQQHV